MSNLDRYMRLLKEYGGDFFRDEKEKEHLALNLLLDLRDGIAEDLFKLWELYKKFPKIQDDPQKISVSIDIYSLIIISAGLMNDNMRKKFHYYFYEDSDKETEYLDLIFEVIPLLYRRYCEAFEFKKNNKSVIFNYCLHHLVFRGIYNFDIPQGKKDSYFFCTPNYYEYFLQDINLLQELNDSFFNNFNYEFFKKENINKGLEPENGKNFYFYDLKPVSYNRKKKLEAAFENLMISKKEIASSLKDTFLEYFGTLPSIEQEKLEVNIDVYSLFIITICLKDNLIKQKFYEYYTDQAGKDINYIQTFCQNTERMFPRYYEAYDHFYNKRYLMFGNYLYELILKGNSEFEFPFGTASFSPILVRHFSLFFSTAMQIKENINEEYNFELL